MDKTSSKLLQKISAKSINVALNLQRLCICERSKRISTVQRIGETSYHGQDACQHGLAR
jgi:hypothetical protein